MCLTPRLMFVKGSGFKKSYPFIVGCGKCYDCQNQQRGEFVLRAKNEFDNSVCAFFLLYLIRIIIYVILLLIFVRLLKWS